MIDIAELTDKIDIVDYIGQFCDLEERDGEWWGLSVFKEENTPSFSVSRDKQLFYDFSSHQGGNILTFIQKYHKVSFRKAINIALNYLNIDESELTTSEQNPTLVLRKFANNKHNVQITPHIKIPQNIMNQYNKSEVDLKDWIEEGISVESLRKYEVGYDKISNRIIYPIKMQDGTIVNLSGRTLDTDYKLKKLRKYTYFYPLGDCDLLYGLNIASQSIEEKNEIIIFEGAKSVMKADTYGIYNTVATLTSHLNEHQMNILLKLGVKIIFAFDSDVNVYDDKHIAVLKNFANIEYIWNYDNLLGEKESPVDRGKDIFLELYKHRRRLR